MTSIITNQAATVALATLRSINSDLDSTNNRVSTGKRINNASEGAAYWSISTTLTSDNGAIGAAKDAISLDKNSVDAASKGLDSIYNSLSTIREKLVAATSTNSDRVSLQNEIGQIQTAIKTSSDNSVMNDGNWLSVDSSKATYTANQNLLTGFSRQNGTVTVSSTAIDTGAFMIYNNSSLNSTTGTGSTTTIAGAVASIAATAGYTAINAAGTTETVTVTVDSAAGSLKGLMDTKYTITTYDSTTGTQTHSPMSLSSMNISSLDDSADSLATIQAYIKIVDATMLKIKTGETSLGTTSSLLASQSNFAQSLIDLNTSSVGSLVDADMEAESTKLKALQTQQQLAVQSLSIANSNTSNLMTLFR